MQLVEMAYNRWSENHSSRALMNKGFGTIRLDRRALVLDFDGTLAAAGFRNNVAPETRLARYDFRYALRMNSKEEEYVGYLRKGLPSFLKRCRNLCNKYGMNLVLFTWSTKPV